MISVGVTEESRLADSLRPFSAQLGVSDVWRAGDQMGVALAQVRRRYLRQSQRRGGDEKTRALTAVSRYLLTGQVSSSVDLMRVCAGSGWINDSGQCVLADRLLRRRLFDMAATVRGRRSRFKAFRGLLQSYWAFPQYSSTTPKSAIVGWQELRLWLAEHYGTMSRHTAHQPAWFRLLGTHRHLLSEVPCAPYAKALLRGNFDDLQRAMNALFIPSDSWLKMDAVLAQISEAVSRPDPAFRAMLPALLTLASGQGELHLPVRASQRALGMLVRRYAMQEAIEADSALFEWVVSRIGEPNRDRAVWDEVVIDASGVPCALTRQMVSDWLKETRINGFFREAVQGVARHEFWSLFAVLMDEVEKVDALELGPEGAALRVRSGELAVVIPHAIDRPVSVFAWRELLSDGQKAKLRARFSQHDVEGGKRVMRSLLGIQGAAGSL